jgi:uncharacterized membrane protein YoaK (UPF0700 family)
MLSVPVFMAVLGLTRLLASGLEAIGLASLRPLLLLQFLLIGGFLGLCVAAGPRIDPSASTAILAGMLGVSAMAVQNALLQISLTGAPSTAVVTTNVTRFMMDVGDAWRCPPASPSSRSRWDSEARWWKALMTALLQTADGLHRAPCPVRPDGQTQATAIL